MNIFAEQEAYDDSDDSIEWANRIKTQFETETRRFLVLTSRGSKHMAQGETARRLLEGRKIGAYCRMNGDDSWTWAVCPDHEVRPCYMVYRDYEAELDHPIV